MGSLRCCKPTRPFVPELQTMSDIKSAVLHSAGYAIYFDDQVITPKPEALNTQFITWNEESWLQIEGTSPICSLTPVAATDALNDDSVQGCLSA